MSHAEFRDRHGLSIRLLSDPECEVCRSYDVVKADCAITANGRPHVLRSTFVIDCAGLVRHALYGVSPKGHAAQVLTLVRTLTH
jgi:peroxiredoxin